MKQGQPEFELQCVIADLLRWGAYPGIYWTAIPNGEDRPRKKNSRGNWYSPTGQRLQRMGVKPGVADLIFLVRGKAVALELKADKTKYQSPEQKAFQKEWEEAGGDYYVKKTYEDAVELLEFLRIIKPVKGSERFEPRSHAA